jgi:hypothetical protein
MGVSYSGGMIVGEHATDIPEPELEDQDLYEWAEDNGMERMSEHYDADDNYTYYGFEVPDVEVSEMRGTWLDDVLEKAAKFKELTGVSARLIGTQNIT